MTVARTSQVVVEVVRTNTAVVARESQVAVEVVRPNSAVVDTQRPQVIICT